MLQDYKLGVRMLLKYPGLTVAGGLALAIAIGITKAIPLSLGLPRGEGRFAPLRGARHLLRPAESLLQLSR